MSAESDFARSIIEWMQDDPLTVTYIQESSGTTDYATGEYTPVVVETLCSAILLDLTRTMSGYSVKFGQLIQQGDKELWLQPPEKSDPNDDPLIINPGVDKILIHSTTYTVVAMTEVNPSGNNPILYNFMLRR